MVNQRFVGPSAEQRNTFAFQRKSVKDHEAETRAKAMQNWKDAALSPDFTWERKPKAVPVVENPEPTANPDAMI